MTRRLVGRRFQLGRAALLGAAAYLAGYLMTDAWLGGRAAGLATEVPVPDGHHVRRARHDVPVGGSSGRRHRPPSTGL